MEMLKRFRVAVSRDTRFGQKEDSAGLYFTLVFFVVLEGGRGVWGMWERGKSG